jgi:hypothetical protein
LGATDEDIMNVRNNLAAIDGLISDYKTNNLEAVNENFETLEKTLEDITAAADKAEEAMD